MMSTTTIPTVRRLQKLQWPTKPVGKDESVLVIAVFAVFDGNQRVSPFCDTEAEALDCLASDLRATEARERVRAATAVSLPVEFTPFTSAPFTGPVKGFDRAWLTDTKDEEDSWGPEAEPERVTLDNYRDILTRAATLNRAGFEYAKTIPVKPPRVTLEPIETILDGLKSHDDRVRRVAGDMYAVETERHKPAGHTCVSTIPDRRWNAHDDGSSCKLKQREWDDIWYQMTQTDIAGIESAAQWFNADELAAEREGWELVQKARTVTGRSRYDRVFEFLTFTYCQLYGSPYDPEQAAQYEHPWYRRSLDPYRRLPEWEWNGQKPFDEWLEQNYKLFKSRMSNAESDDGLTTALPMGGTGGEGGEDGDEDEASLAEERMRGSMAGYTFDRFTRLRKVTMPSRRAYYKIPKFYFAFRPVMPAVSELEHYRDPVLNKLHAQMSPDEVALYLDRRDGMTFVEMGAKYGVAEDTARMRFTRAMKIVFPGFRRVDKQTAAADVVDVDTEEYEADDVEAEWLEYGEVGQ